MQKVYTIIGLAAIDSSFRRMLHLNPDAVLGEVQLAAAEQTEMLGGCPIARTGTSLAERRGDRSSRRRRGRACCRRGGAGSVREPEGLTQPSHWRLLDDRWPLTCMERRGERCRTHRSS